MKKIYKFYKDRLIEISGKNRSLYAKKISSTYSYDVGQILEGDADRITEFVDFLWQGKRKTYDLISKSHKARLVENLNKAKQVDGNEKVKKKKSESSKPAVVKVLDEKTVIASQVKILKKIKRNIEDFERETGRYELFVGYPFVEGYVDKDTAVKAPLLLFPIVVHVDGSETSVQIELKPGESIQLNKVLFTAYARQHKINLDEFDMEFDDLRAAGFKKLEDVLKYLSDAGIKINSIGGKKNAPNTLMCFDNIKEPKSGDSLTLRNAAVLGRFPLANSIYNDYTRLEQKNLTTEAISALVENKRPLLSRFGFKKNKKIDHNTYTVHALDYAQESAIEQLGKSGNMVIYGPPGTGKSQTIVNTITDALAKNKRILVVSQKKAALDVVYNRLGNLNKKAMYIVDPEKAKASFFEGVKNTHIETMAGEAVDMNTHQVRFEDVTTTLNAEIDHLKQLSDILFNPTSYGISLQEMYANSRIISKNDGEYVLYESMLQHEDLLSFDYPTLCGTVRTINEKKRAELYYKRIEMQRCNPYIDHILSGLDVHTLNSVKTFLNDFISKRMAPFDIARYSNMRQLLGFYLENGLTTQSQLKPIINYIAKLHSLKAKEVSETFWRILEEVKAYVGEYYLLSRILDRKGFAMAVDNIIGGNTHGVKMILSALDDYSVIRDLNTNLGACSFEETALLNFAYENSDSLPAFKKVIESLCCIRTYHEIVLYEEAYKQELSFIMDFENIKTRIVSLKDEQRRVVGELCNDTFKNSYKELYNANPENNNFFHQISKPQNLWPIRKLIENYSELLFSLFPCWLLSPENVSTLLPLIPGLFDLILFDEASQVFIESTIPTIYRGKHIAVAGDNKQLRPTAHFVRRFMGNDEDDFDVNTQAALEVESLLDLATSRFDSARLNYHYRSKFEELINFSNYAFYDCKLQVVPNLGKSLGNRPIERIKVDGRWIDRHNEMEANRIVELLKKIIKERKNNETIGIITFNVEQGNQITDMIDAACLKDNAFRETIALERNRKEHGEDVSLFVKNLENVQGDERDIIIFSIGYAQNEYGKVVSQFGPLNLEGGENRLNVAITRAKSKIYVVTSIEPEQLNVENAKNLGPKLFKKYLEYVRAVSSGNLKEVDMILSSLAHPSLMGTQVQEEKRMSLELKAILEKHGYTVELNVGGSANKLTLAIYDKEFDTYLVGVECDYTALNTSPSVLERDVFRPKFMESRGWRILRVWSREFWLNKNKVVAQIEKAAKKAQDKLRAAKANKTITKKK